MQRHPNAKPIYVRQCLEDIKAVNRYGPEGFIFFDENGFFNVMDRDVEDGEPGHRPGHIMVRSSIAAKVSGGAW